jgi:glycosyltransferase involved in cell wall biosynthesis
MISVVIPAYNAGRFIKRTIDSVLAQTFTDYELIVVDDGSTDNTGEIVKGYGPKVRYIYQKNAGDGPARNAGIAAAIGEWIAFLDHDDEWLPEKLAVQTELLEKNPTLKWCAASYYQSWQGRRKVISDSPSVLKLLGGKDFLDSYFSAVTAGGTILIMTSTMLVRKSTFDELGVFDSCWRRAADQDMWWRIAHTYPQIGFVSRPLSIMHLDVQSGVNKELALEGKRGQEAKALVQRHLVLAKEHGDIRLFKKFASGFLFSFILTALYHGFKSDAWETARAFPELFGFCRRAFVYLLTIVPGVPAIMRTVYKIYQALGLQKTLTRNYDHSEVVAAVQKPTS